MDTIGKYKIIKKIGRGAFGEVYKAYDTILERSVALKILSEEHLEKKEVVSRFGQEAKTISQMQDNNIVTVFDFGVHGDRPFIVMEFLEGIDLRAVINSKRSMPVEQKVSIIKQVAQGLYNAHQRGIIHRDIKPANIRLLDKGVVKIMDFGIARMPSSDMTKTGAFMGTPFYMSPEQLQGTKRVDTRADLFSLGVVFYEFLTYKKPFDGDNPLTVLHKIVNNPTPALGELDERFAPLRDIITRLLEKDPDLRYQDARELIHDLDEMEGIHPTFVGFPGVQEQASRGEPVIEATELLDSDSRPSTGTDSSPPEAQRAGASQPVSAAQEQGTDAAPKESVAVRITPDAASSRTARWRHPAVIGAGAFALLIALAGVLVTRDKPLKPDVLKLLSDAEAASAQVDTFPQAIAAYREAIAKLEQRHKRPRGPSKVKLDFARAELTRLDEAYGHHEAAVKVGAGLELASRCEQEGELAGLARAIEIVEAMEATPRLGEQARTEIVAYMNELEARRFEADEAIAGAMAFCYESRYDEAFEIIDRLKSDFPLENSLDDLAQDCQKDLISEGLRKEAEALLVQASRADSPRDSCKAIETLRTKKYYPRLTTSQRSRLNSQRALLADSLKAGVEQSLLAGRCAPAAAGLEHLQACFKDAREIMDWTLVKADEINRCTRVADLRRLAEEAVKTQNPNTLLETVQGLQGLLAAAPEDRDARSLQEELKPEVLSKARRALESGKLELADDLALQFGRIDPDNQECRTLRKEIGRQLFAQARQSLDREAYERAHSLAERVKRIEPEDAKAADLLSMAKSKLLEDQAEQLEADGRFLEASTRIDQALEANRFNESAKSFQSKLRNKISRSRQWIKEAAEQMEKGNILDATNKLRAALMVLPEDANGLGLLKDCEVRLVRDARAALHAARQQDSQEPEEGSKAIFKKLFQGSFDCVPEPLKPAIDYGRKAYEINPSNQDALLLLKEIAQMIAQEGADELASNHPGKAKTCAKTALDLDPDNAQAGALMARVQK